MRLYIEFMDSNYVLHFTNVITAHNVDGVRLMHFLKSNIDVQVQWVFLNMSLTI